MTSIVINADCAIQIELFDVLCASIPQTSDNRQRQMGLQYSEDSHEAIAFALTGYAVSNQLTKLDSDTVEQIFSAALNRAYVHRNGPGNQRIMTAETTDLARFGARIIRNHLN